MILVTGLGNERLGLGDRPANLPDLADTSGLRAIRDMEKSLRFLARSYKASMGEELSLLDSLREPGKVVYVGCEGAHILFVTRDALEYVDRAGESWLIDLEKCRENWCWYFNQRRSEFFIFPGVTEEQVQAENAATVAMRGTRYVQFFDDRRTRFEFGSNRERWKLQAALLSMGWRTFDME